MREFFKNEYFIIYMNNKINILTEKKNSNKSEIDYLNSKMKIKKNFLRIYNNFKFSFCQMESLIFPKLKRFISFK